MILRLLLLSVSLLSLPALAEEASAKPMTDQLARGLLMLHDGRMIFAPCRDRSYSTVEDFSDKAAVSAALGQLGLAPGKNLYVEFVALLAGDTLRVSSINFARREARCQNGGDEETWRAAGPGWSLAAGAGKLLLKQGGQPAQEFTYVETMGKDAVSLAVMRGGARTEWRFVRQFCSDDSAGVLLGWQAELQVEGATLKGCAWQR